MANDGEYNFDGSKKKTGTTKKEDAKTIREAEKKAKEKKEVKDK